MAYLIVCLAEDRKSAEGVIGLLMRERPVCNGHRPWVRNPFSTAALLFYFISRARTLDPFGHSIRSFQPFESFNQSLNYSEIQSRAKLLVLYAEYPMALVLVNVGWHTSFTLRDAYKGSSIK